MIVEIVSILDSLVRATERLIVIHMVLNSSVFGSSFSTEYCAGTNHTAEQGLITQLIRHESRS